MVDDGIPGCSVPHGGHVGCGGRHAADAAGSEGFDLGPADDLANQVDQYIGDLAKMVATEEEYKDSEERIVNDSNTLVVIALTLGLHDQDSKYKPIGGR